MRSRRLPKARTPPAADTRASASAPTNTAFRHAAQAHQHGIEKCAVAPTRYPDMRRSTPTRYRDMRHQPPTRLQTIRGRLRNPAATSAHGSTLLDHPGRPPADELLQIRELGLPLRPASGANAPRRWAVTQWMTPSAFGTSSRTRSCARSGLVSSWTMASSAESPPSPRVKTSSAKALRHEAHALRATGEEQRLAMPAPELVVGRGRLVGHRVEGTVIVDDAVLQDLDEARAFVPVRRVSTSTIALAPHPARAP